MFSFLKKCFRFCTLTALFVLGIIGTYNANACHLAAADISVKYIGPNVDGCSGTAIYRYEVEVITYYACQTCQGNGGQASRVYFASASAQAEGLPNYQGDSAINDPVLVADTTHQLCPAFDDSNSCKTNLATANRYPAFRVRKRVGTVTLPYARTDWRFWWSEGARSNSNIAGCGSLYVEAGLDNLTKYNNSTVKFESNPLPYLCVNQPTTYLNEPFDPNGDSISVIAQTPFTGANNPCTYVLPSTVQNQIGSPTGFNLNSSTGSVSFTPAATGQYVFAFRGEDYLKGTTKRLSYVYRDVQVSVLPCNAPPPAIDSVGAAIGSITNGTIINTKNSGDAVFVCPGSNLNFSLNSKSFNPTSKVYMSATSQTIVGYNFTTNGQGTGNVTGTFAWTPTIGDIGQHTLTVISKDSTCLISQPIVLPNYTVIVIKVLSGLDAGRDLPTCELNPEPVQLFVYGADDLRLKWSLDGGPAEGISDDTLHNPTATIGRTVDYVISTPDLKGTCKASDTVRLYVDTSNSIRIVPENPLNPDNALVMCRPGYLQLEALLVGRPPKNNVACGTNNVTTCAVQDTANLYGSAVFGKIAYDTIGTVTPILYTTLKTSKMQYLIRRNEMEENGIYSATIRNLTMTTSGHTTIPTHVYANFRILIKCTDIEELDAADGFENFGFTEVFNAATITFPDGEHTFPFSSRYNWDTTKNLLIQICYSDNPTVDTACGVTSAPPIVAYVPTSYASALMLRGASVSEVSVCDIDKSDAIQSSLGRPLFKFGYCEADPLPYYPTWNRGELLTDTTILQPLAYVPKSSTFVVQTLGRSNCLIRDTLEVYVPESDKRVEPVDTSLCLGDRAPFTVWGGHYFKWYEFENGQFVTPKSVQDPTKGHTFIGPDKTTEYRIVVSDSVWCYDTLKANIKILPLPDVRIVNEDDTVVKYGQSFQLLATGARLYNWSPVSSLNNPNISYPIARPTEDTKYIVGGIATNGCRAFDTLHVIVDKRDNLFVPSAFSPNGDGKNDVFKITNLSFQRIMEFRVFNRWGQEVYSTNDSRAGWDGNWGGVPQGIGTYTYLIRVAYPDGFVETYKGETTLIR